MLGSGLLSPLRYSVLGPASDRELSKEFLVQLLAL